jgi:hypothetical protein
MLSRRYRLILFYLFEFEQNVRNTLISMVKLIKATAALSTNGERKSLKIEESRLVDKNI